MADKIRLTQHSGKGSAQHNDREDILRAKEKGKDIQDKHIDLERTKDNKTIVFDENNNISKRFKGRLDKPLHEYEKEFYERRYGESLRITNEKYLKQRHPEKVKTIDDMLKTYSGRTFNGKDRPNPTAPEEIIIQVGNMHDNIDPEVVRACFNEYSIALIQFAKEHNENIHLLDVSLHMDEAVPHLHIRRVIDYKDEQGLHRVGQIKGLEQAEIPLPDPTKPRSRFNNRKMTIDKIMRDKFIEICKSHGLEIEEIPEKGKKHNRTKEEVIAESLERQAEQAKTIEALKENEIEALNDGIETLNNMPADVIQAIDDVLELPEGTFAAIANKAIASKQTTWGASLTSLRQDIARDVQLYQSGYLTDKDIMPKDREREQSRDTDLEL